MSATLPNGATLSIAATYGVTKSMSAITNAVEAVATLEASHGVVENDILEVTSGWSRLDGRIVRADSVATNDVTLEDIDTSSTTRYPAGSGVGSVREIATWTQITQVLEFAMEGGDQQFTTFSYLEDDQERLLPTQRSAQSFRMQLADDQTLAWYALLLAADQDRVPRALRITLPSGANLYYNGIVSMNPTPVLTKNQVMALQVAFALTAPPTRYAA